MSHYPTGKRTISFNGTTMTLALAEIGDDGDCCCCCGRNKCTREAISGPKLVPFIVKMVGLGICLINAMWMGIYGALWWKRINPGFREASHGAFVLWVVVLLLWIFCFLTGGMVGVPLSFAAIVVVTPVSCVKSHNWVRRPFCPSNAGLGKMNVEMISCPGGNAR